MLTVSGAALTYSLLSNPLSVLAHPLYPPVAAPVPAVTASRMGAALWGTAVNHWPPWEPSGCWQEEFVQYIYSKYQLIACYTYTTYGPSQRILGQRIPGLDK